MAADVMLDRNNLPSVATAPLPATYEAAKRALSQCVSIDECQMWANKAEALASYARQAEDRELRHMADRIQARAVDKCGELLREIPPGKNRFDRQEGDLPPNRITAATEAGLSEHQRKQALRVNAVPREQFEEMVEAEEPATVTELAALGTKSRDHLQGRDPADFEQATRLIGLSRYIVERSAQINLDAASRGLLNDERQKVQSQINQALDWLEEAGEVVDGVQHS